MVTAKLAALNRALAKTCRSTIGCELRSPTATQAARMTRPPAAMPTVVPLSQPCCGASMIA